MDKKIYLEFPIEDRNDTMEFEIYFNGKFYILLNQKMMMIIIRII